jgi:hypothetical protein
MGFRKYQRIKRLGEPTVAQVTKGVTYIFPKLDGANASVWTDDGYTIKCGSRNNELTPEHNNRHFYQYVQEHKGVAQLLRDNPNLILYGEWLVPHSFRNYFKEAWENFFVFDVYDKDEERYLPYSEYYELVDSTPNLHYVRPLAKIENPSYQDIAELLDKNFFMVDTRKGVPGEGVVIKNYSKDYAKQTGQTWAKLVRDEFIEESKKEKPKDSNEEYFVEKFCTASVIDKTYHKVLNSVEDNWQNKYIQRLFSTVLHDIIEEDIWRLVTKKKYPVIDFSRVKQLVIEKVKDWLDQNIEGVQLK